MSRTNDEAPSNFPHWVALGSLAFVLWLSFSNLVPAMRERGQLHAMRAEFVKLREDYDVAILPARVQNSALRSLQMALSPKNSCVARASIASSQAFAICAFEAALYYSTFFAGSSYVQLPRRLPDHVLVMSTCSPSIMPTACIFPL